MITVDNPVEKVFARWSKEAAIPTCGKNYSMDRSKIPSRFPYMRMLFMGSPTNNCDLEGNESSSVISFQIDTFTNGEKSLSEVYRLDEISHKSMVEMGFRRIYGPALLENGNTIKRVVSRYSRLYTGQLLGEK